MDLLRCRIFLIRAIYSLALLAIFSSCHKKDGTLQVNKDAPQDDYRIEQTPYALSGMSGEIEEITKLIRVKGQGFIFLAKNHTSWYFGKLSELGHTMEYVYPCKGKPTDIAVDSDFRGQSQYVYVSGGVLASGNALGRVYRYSIRDGSLDYTYIVPNSRVINALQFTPAGLFCAGYWFTNPSGNVIQQLEVGRSPGIGATYPLPYVAKNVTSLAALSDSTFIVAYDSLEYKELRKVKLGSETSSLVGFHRLRTPFKISEDLIVKCSDSILMVASGGSIPGYQNLDVLSFKYRATPPQYNVLIDRNILGDVLYHDFHFAGGILYVCGVSNYTQFHDFNNIVGNAMFLKIKDGIVSPYTFGNPAYLTAFQSMTFTEQFVYFSGYTEKSFYEESNFSWYNNVSTSKPYFVKLDLSKL